MISEDYLKKRGRSIPIKKPLSVEIKKSIFMLMATLLVIIVLVGIVYLLNSSQSSQKGYTLKQEQLHKDKLIEDSRTLINKIIDAKASSNLTDKSLFKNMVKPERVDYLDPQPQE